MEAMDNFPWVKAIQQSFSKTFTTNYSIEALESLDKNLQKEMEEVTKSKDKKRLKNLFFCIRNFYNHFCWKIDWTKDVPLMKLSCLKILSAFIQTGLMLCKGDVNSEWLNIILAAMKLFPGSFDLLCDSLFLLNSLKKSSQHILAVILKHFLFTYKLNIPDVPTYFKIMLLFRRLKVLTENQLEKSKIIVKALGIKVPNDYNLWLLEKNIRQLNGKDKKVVPKLILGKNLPRAFFEELRRVLQQKLSFEREDTLHVNHLDNINENNFVIDTFASTDDCPEKLKKGGCRKRRRRNRIRPKKSRSKASENSQEHKSLSADSNSDFLNLTSSRRNKNRSKKSRSKVSENSQEHKSLSADSNSDFLNLTSSKEISKLPKIAESGCPEMFDFVIDVEASTNDHSETTKRKKKKRKSQKLRSKISEKLEEDSCSPHKKRKLNHSEDTLCYKNLSADSNSELLSSSLCKENSFIVSESPKKAESSTHLEIADFVINITGDKNEDFTKSEVRGQNKVDDTDTNGIVSEANMQIDSNEVELFSIKTAAECEEAVLPEKNILSRAGSVDSGNIEENIKMTASAFNDQRVSEESVESSKDVIPKLCIVNAVSKSIKSDEIDIRSDDAETELKNELSDFVAADITIEKGDEISENTSLIQEEFKAMVSSPMNKLNEKVDGVIVDCKNELIGSETSLKNEMEDIDSVRMQMKDSVVELSLNKTVLESKAIERTSHLSAQNKVIGGSQAVQVTSNEAVSISEENEEIILEEDLCISKKMSSKSCENVESTNKTHQKDVTKIVDEIAHAKGDTEGASSFETLQEEMSKGASPFSLQKIKSCLSFKDFSSEASNCSSPKIVIKKLDSYRESYSEFKDNRSDLTKSEIDSLSDEKSICSDGFGSIDDECESNQSFESGEDFDVEEDTCATITDSKNNLIPDPESAKVPESDICKAPDSDINKVLDLDSKIPISDCYEILDLDSNKIPVSSCVEIISGSDNVSILDNGKAAISDSEKIPISDSDKVPFLESVTVSSSISKKSLEDSPKKRYIKSLDLTAKSDLAETKETTTVCVISNKYDSLVEHENKQFNKSVSKELNSSESGSSSDKNEPKKLSGSIQINSSPVQLKKLSVSLDPNSVPLAKQLSPANSSEHARRSLRKRPLATQSEDTQPQSSKFQKRTSSRKRKSVDKIIVDSLNELTLNSPKCKSLRSRRNMPDDKGKNESSLESAPESFKSKKTVSFDEDVIELPPEPVQEIIKSKETLSILDKQKNLTSEQVTEDSELKVSRSTRSSKNVKNDDCLSKNTKIEENSLKNTKKEEQSSKSTKNDEAKSSESYNLRSRRTLILPSRLKLN